MRLRFACFLPFGSRPAWLLAAASLISAAVLNGAETTFWDGTSVVGPVQFDGKAFVVGKTRKAPTAVFTIRYAARSRRARRDVRVILRNGSSLVGAVQPSTSFKTIGLQRHGQVLTIPGSRIASLEFGPLQEGAQVEETPAGAYVIMRTGKVIACEAQWLTFLDLGVKTRAGSLRLKQDSIYRLVLAPVKHTRGAVGNFRVRTGQGDSIAGRLLTLDDAALQLQTDLGRIRFSVRELFAVEAVSDRVVSLLTLKPAAVREVAYLDFIRPHRLNQNLFGGALISRGVYFDSGVAVHARTDLDYRLDGAYCRFVVSVGLDTTMTDQGDAEFVVLGDGKELQRLRATGHSELAHINVDVLGVKVLTLRFDYGRNGSAGDHGIWGNPQLVRKP